MVHKHGGTYKVKGKRISGKAAHKLGLKRK